MKNWRWDPVAERISRWARIELLKILFGMGLSRSDIARLCKVSKSAVSRWVRNPTYHPNNQHTVILLKGVWRRNPKSMKKLLQSEAKKFIRDLKDAGVRVDRGVN